MKLHKLKQSVVPNIVFIIFDAKNGQNSRRRDIQHTFYLLLKIANNWVKFSSRVTRGGGGQGYRDEGVTRGGGGQNCQIYRDVFYG